MKSTLNKYNNLKPIYKMCNKCFSVVQFAGILPTDTDVTVNGGAYPQNDTVQDLTDNNPQFWFEAGISGVNTLTTYAVVGDVDLTLSVTRGGNTVTVIGSFIGGHPIHRPR